MMQNPDTLLIILNGNGSRILESNQIDETSTLIIKTDEKNLAKFGYMRRLLNKHPYNRILFACIEDELQRFTFFISLFILLSSAKSGGIIDEKGNHIQYSFTKFIFKQLPCFLFEIMISLIVVVYFHIKLPILKWILSTKH